MSMLFLIAYILQSAKFKMEDSCKDLKHSYIYNMLCTINNQEKHDFQNIVKEANEIRT